MAEGALQFVVFVWRARSNSLVRGTLNPIAIDGPKNGVAISHWNRMFGGLGFAGKVAASHDDSVVRERRSIVETDCYATEDATRMDIPQ